MNLYQKIEQFVTDAFTKANKPTDVFHAQRTVHWIKELKPVLLMILTGLLMATGKEALLIQTFCGNIKI